MIFQRYLKPKRAGILLILIILIAGSGFFSIRAIMLKRAIHSANLRLSAHQYTAHWDDAGFRGLSTLFIKGLYIRSVNGNNEAQIDSVKLGIRITPLLFGNIRIRNFDCRALSVRYFSADSLKIEKNEAYDSLPASSSFFEKDLAAFLYKNSRRFFGYVPSRMFFGRVVVRYDYAGNTTLAEMIGLTIKKGDLTGLIRLSGKNMTAELPFMGKIIKKNSLLAMQISHSDTGLLPLPLLKDKFGISGGFDTLSFNIDFSGSKRHDVRVKGNFRLIQCELNGARISDEKIIIDNMLSDFRINVSEHAVEIDSSTRASLNRIRFNPYLKITFQGNPVAEFKILPVKWDAGDFFNSLPSGMFSSLTGLKAQGSLKYFLNFKVDLGMPDSLTFDTRLRSEDFKVLSYGTEDYRLLNGAFVHRVYEKGRLVTSFQVGTENPDFVPFERISPYLRSAVMTSEDGSFFYHRGFNAEAFRESIVVNIKEKRFARGGSTISMQLVKNVFLTRKKNLARKIEEALIVWMIENENLVSKQRMYEVYLNIIEWGPGVYGINQASRFYFDKSPSELTLPESVYLASIVPQPKWYRYAFMKNGQLKSYYDHYFHRMLDLMVRKEFIVPADTFGVNPNVMLYGDASRVFAATDSVMSDTLKTDDLEFLLPF